MGTWDHILIACSYFEFVISGSIHPIVEIPGPSVPILLTAQEPPKTKAKAKPRADPKPADPQEPAPAP